MSESAYEFLASHELLTLATASSSGVPHAAAVFYVSEGSTVFFSVPPESETGQNLAANAKASVAVADVPDPGEDWSAARGIQVSGAVSQLDGDEADSISTRFGERYPHLGAIVTHSPFFRLDPEVVEYVHNDEPGDDALEALGVSWRREHITKS